MESSKILNRHPNVNIQGAVLNNDVTTCLSRINAIIEEQQVEACFILGDFNAHSGELFGNEL